MTEKNIHETISDAVLDTTTSGTNPDDVTKRVLSDLDEQGFVIVPTDEWSNLTNGPAPEIADARVEALRQALRESNAMNHAAVESLSRFSHRDSIPRDALKTAMRQAYEDALRDEIGQHGEIAGRLS